MGVYINPNNRMFQRALDDLFYVDKTGLAVFLNERMGTARGLVCCSRPRRFGKSVDADMLVAYYSRGCDSQSQFDGLAVSHDPSYNRHLNGHDVIKLDMTQIMPHASSPCDVGGAVVRELTRELREEWPSLVTDGEASLPHTLSRI